MDIVTVIVRLIHIVGGVFWAGALMFTAIFLEPSVRDAGPGGAGVMRGLMARNFLNIMPVVAILTVLSGIEMMRRDSVGFQPAWFSSPFGLTLSIGGVVALVALVVGAGIMRPTMMRIGKLAAAAADVPEGADKDARMSEINALRARARTAGRAVAGLLTVAVACMAVARYLG